MPQRLCTSVIRTCSGWVCAGILVVLAACGGGSNSDGPNGSCDTTPPVLSVTEIDFTTVTVVEFLPFGFPLSPGQLNPAYELRVSPTNAQVRAVAAGIVEAVEPNVQGDFEVRVRARAGSCYLMIYDHLLNVTVTAGTSVAPGQVLGQVGPWDLMTGTGRTELQIDVDRPSGMALNTVAVCPVSLGTMEFNAAHDAAYAQAGHGGSGVCWQQEVVP